MATRYLRFLVLNTITLLVVFIGIAYYADPTGLLATSNMKSNWGCTPGIRINQYVAKPAMLSTHEYDAVLLGTSRVAAGINTGDFTAITGIHNAYNAATPGLKNHELLQYLELLKQDKQLSTLYIGLDLGMFIPDDEITHTGGMLAFLDSEPGMPTKYNIILRAHLNREALIGALTTVFDDLECHDPEISAQGHFSVRRHAKRVQQQGYRKLNDNVTATIEKMFASYAKTKPWRNDYQSLRNELNKLQNKLGEICHPDMRIRIFTNPLHVSISSGINQSLPGATAAYKKSLAQMNDKLEAVGCDIQTWDFAVTNSYTTASFPDNNDPDDASTLFWESSHYKRALGMIMLNNIHSPALDSIGVKLSSSNIDAHVAAQEELLLEHLQHTDTLPSGD